MSRWSLRSLRFTDQDGVISVTVMAVKISILLLTFLERKKLVLGQRFPTEQKFPIPCLIKLELERYYHESDVIALTRLFYK